MKKDAYYFPHFCNARNDAKIIKLRRVLGLEGYAIYFMLLEVLREQTTFKYPLSGIEDIAFEWHTSKEKVLAVISNFGLFEMDNENFFSVKFVTYLQPYLEKSARASLAANKRWDKVKKEMTLTDENDAKAYTKALQMQSKCNASKVNKKKVNESKEKKNSNLTEINSTELKGNFSQKINEKQIKNFADKIINLYNTLYRASETIEDVHQTFYENLKGLRAKNLNAEDVDYYMRQVAKDDKLFAKASLLYVTNPRYVFAAKKKRKGIDNFDRENLTYGN